MIEFIIQKPTTRLKCPNCGAHYNGVKCEYCDTVFTYNLCTPDIRQEYLNECYKRAVQGQYFKNEVEKLIGGTEDERTN